MLTAAERQQYIDDALESMMGNEPKWDVPERMESLCADIEDQAKRIEELEAERAIMREVFVGIRKTQQWLEQLLSEQDPDENAIGSAQGALDDTLSLAVDLADAKWTTSYLERVKASNTRTAKLQARTAELKAIVGGYPKTEDGVYIHTGNTVWDILDEEDVTEYFVASIKFFAGGRFEVDLGNEYARYELDGGRRLYSSPEAAEAALKEKS